MNCVNEVVIHCKSEKLHNGYECSVKGPPSH